MKAEDKFIKYRPKKFFGHNFLVDNNISSKIVASLDLKEDDVLIEIGPGLGALTKHIAGKVKNFSAIEIDRTCSDKLKEAYPDSINFLNEDFLETNLKSFFTGKHKIKIAGNIPYNITSQILFKLFDDYEILDSAVLMMQKEVAARLSAHISTKDYGILAVQTQYYCEIQNLFNVPPTAFFPKPNVNSSVVKFVFKSNLEISDLNFKKVFRSFVRSSFSQRRKTMKNALKEFATVNNINLNTLDFDFSRRAESVSVPEYTSITKEIVRQYKTNII